MPRGRQKPVADVGDLADLVERAKRTLREDGLRDAVRRLSELTRRLGAVARKKGLAVLRGDVADAPARVLPP
jgi:hypothetical protein